MCVFVRSGMRLCECGCGQPTRPARQTNTKLGWTKGEPIRYIVGHSGGHQDWKPLDRFLDKTRLTDSGCWEWVGSKTKWGYGSFRVRASEGGKLLHAHRWSYEHYVGAIPEGLEIDHL